MHSWSFGKHKRKYITDNDIDMKFGPDVINSAANSWKKQLGQNLNPAKFELKIHISFCPQ